MQRTTILYLFLALFFLACGNEPPAPPTATDTTPTISESVATSTPDEIKGNELAPTTSTQEVQSTTPNASPQPMTTTSTATNNSTLKVTLQPQSTAGTQSNSNYTPPSGQTLNITEKEPTVTRAMPVVKDQIASTAADVVLESQPVTSSPPDHGAWDQLLREAVSRTGAVDYAALKRKQPALEGYLNTLSTTPPQADWGKNATMAYWINAYNAYTVKLILDNYPVSSIKDLHSGNPWDVKWIKIGNKSYSLNQIENEELRTRYGDARIHFAVNCAAKSCPPLHNRAFTAGNLSSKLASLTRRFINDSAYNELDASPIVISQIFNWYGGDFGDVKTYLNRYLEEPLTEDVEVHFAEYDWGLND
ncbi:MAG: DUF547 domain-containing protein [Bacteroidota bacterium]